MKAFIQFFEVVTGAFVYLAQYKQELFRALLIPFVASVLIAVLDSKLELGFGASLLLAICSGAIYTLMAVTTHRMVLLGPESVGKWGLNGWSMRETWFAMYLVGVIFALVPVAFLSFIPVVGTAITFVVACLLAGRLSLVFPGIAIGKRVGFVESWELTRSYELLMVLIVGVLPLLVGLPSLATDMIPGGFILTNIISTFAMIFEIATLSVAYHLIVRQDWPEDGPKEVEQLIDADEAQR